MIDHIAINGYRLFKDFETDLQPGMNVLIGANGSGKSSLVEFLRIVQSCALGPLQPGIERRGPPGVVLHPEAMFDTMLLHLNFVLPETVRAGDDPICCYAYHMAIEGVAPQVIQTEQLLGASDRGRLAGGKGQPLFQAVEGTGRMFEGQAVAEPPEWLLKPGEPMLSRCTDPTRRHSSWVREYILQWRLYTDLTVNRNAAIRVPHPLGGGMVLSENGENLIPVLLAWSTNVHCRNEWDDLLSFVTAAVPELTTLAPTLDPTGPYAGLQWIEHGVGSTLSAADLSDGILRLLILGAVCCSPYPPPLICIDEPEIGLHPKVLPLVAGLLRHAAERSQVIVLTHSPELLYDMPLESIAVMRKRNGQAVLVWPRQHDLLCDLLTKEVAAERQIDRTRLRRAFTSGELDELG